MTRLMKIRSSSGNMLVLVAAFTFVILALCLFGLGYLRILGSSSEQKTAIEAAALAAAREISNIVIDTPEFGYVGISDSAPIGTVTQAGDTFYTPVHSINTLIGTARLDLIIADQLGIPELEELALTDLTAAKLRASQLEGVIAGAITPAGSAQDKHGNTITPYVAAETAYQQNQVRMTGASNYVAGSLQLNIGALSTPGLTNVPIPNPPSADPSLSNSNTLAGNYKSYMNIPYNGQNFVFAGIGDAVRIVDPKQFTTSPGLPFFYKTIVRAEAQQNVTDTGLSKNSTIRAVACAQPASVFDPKPYPGALTISFPDGMPTGPTVLTTPASLYNAPLNAGNQSDFYRAALGDYPVDLGSNIAYDASWPLASDTDQLASNACKIAMYDWLKRAGTKANVNSVLGMHTTPFDPQGAPVNWGPTSFQIPRGIVHIYRFDSDGLVSYDSEEVKPKPWYVVGHQQSFIECFDVLQNCHPTPTTFSPIALPSAFFSWPVATPNGQVEMTTTYDMFVRIYSRRMGRTNGGKHAGEPMDNTLVATAAPVVNIASNPKRGLTIYDSVFSGYGAKKKWWKKGQTGFVGAPPGLTSRDDFSTLPGGTINPAPSEYEKYDATGGGVRVTYNENGSVSEIRFRRVLQIGDDLSNSEFAFVGEK